MKRLLILMLALSLCAGAVACSRSDGVELETSAESSAEDTTASESKTETEKETEADTTDYGKLKIKDVTAWKGYPATEFFPVFEKPEYAEKLDFEYDEKALTVDAEKYTVKAIKAGAYTVKVSSEHFSTSFIVNCETVDKTTEKYNINDKYNAAGRATAFNTKWTQEGNAGSTVIFFGDSYLDADNHVPTFYTELYPNKDVLCFGIGGTSSYHWETLIYTLLKNTAPSAFVINLGTNNVYNKADDTLECASALQRLFVRLHGEFPDVPIYWFDIVQRSYANDSTRMAYVNAINVKMRDFCADRAWITCVEVADGITSDMLSDNVHVKLEHYNIYTQALANAGLVIPDKRS